MLQHLERQNEYYWDTNVTLTSERQQVPVSGSIFRLAKCDHDCGIIRADDNQQTQLCSGPKSVKTWAGFSAWSWVERKTSEAHRGWALRSSGTELKHRQTTLVLRCLHWLKRGTPPPLTLPHSAGLPLLHTHRRTGQCLNSRHSFIHLFWKHNQVQVSVCSFKIWGYH